MNIVKNRKIATIKEIFDMKNRTVVIVGGSAGANICEEIFQEIYGRVLFLETYAKNIPEEKLVADKISDGLNFLKDDLVDYFIATGDNKQRFDNFMQIKKVTKKVPVNCIHRTAFIAQSAIIGYGNLIGPKSVIHTNAVIGNNTIINTAAVVDHDCIISDYAQVSPNATLCGRVKVGEYAFVGAGSVVIPEVSIGKNSIVAAGSSVTKDVENNKLYAGVPAVKKKDL